MIVKAKKEKLVNAIEKILDYRPINIWIQVHGFDLELVGANIKGTHYRVKAYDALDKWYPLKSDPITSVLIRVYEDAEDAEIEFFDE